MNAASPLHDPPALKVESLEVWRGESRLFAALGFSLQPGQMALVTGANGSGKTTLLRVLAGLTVPIAGSVTWSGTPVHRLEPVARGAIAYQGHLDGLKKELTVAENLAFYKAFWNGQRSGDSLLDRLRLSGCRDRPVRYLSAGQRRRAALGCMRLRPAKLWLLDEPLTNLDARGAELVAEWLAEHTAAGGLAVVATHQRSRLLRSATVEIGL
ncbi:MAG: heme ABC exporter ATP-binding protein CcmA [Rhodospirillaceae bacterium]|nr:heme ABC exporter ATP-binding protein CcmA [Rhodospirillaceae bacterium]